jgi:hypothetical protein
MSVTLAGLEPLLMFVILHCIAVKSRGSATRLPSSDLCEGEASFTIRLTAQRAWGALIEGARLGDESKAVGFPRLTALLSVSRLSWQPPQTPDHMGHGPRVILSPMVALSDNQLAALITAAGKLPVEKRHVFLRRVVARLSLIVRFTAPEFDDAVRLALRGLIQEKSAA